MEQKNNKGLLLSPQKKGAQEDGASMALAVEEATESELSSLPISRLLQFLSNQLIFTKKLRAKEKLLKVLNSLLTANALKFENSDLFFFHQILFKDRNDPQLANLLRNLQLQIAQRLSIRGIGELDKNQIMKFLKLLLTNDTLLSGSEREEFLHAVLSKIFQSPTIFSNLSNQDLFYLCEKRLIETFSFLDDSSSALVPTQVSALQKVVSQLYLRRSSLSSKQLLQLFAFSAQNLNTESQAIIDELYKKQSKIESDSSQSSPIVLISPNSSLNSPLNPSELKSNPNDPDSDSESDPTQPNSESDSNGFESNSKSNLEPFKSARNETFVLDTILHTSPTSADVSDLNKNINLEPFSGSIGIGGLGMPRGGKHYPFS
eukprot:TRINITY_DN25783_c0_g1_i1.p1 TRINITY_DN25783_c0_g1~~TRINITY_DN25783_c0_g1_i1.p1  ORF type:complete len:375 (+),score=104.81 TRINITY_DN25783_c0_g1_i1:108-1232(+)